MKFIYFKGLTVISQNPTTVKIRYLSKFNSLFKKTLQLYNSY